MKKVKNITNRSNNNKYFDIQEWKNLESQITETIANLTKALEKL